MSHNLFSFLTQFHFPQHGNNPSNLRLFKSAMMACFHAEDTFVSLSSLVANPMDWLANTPPGSSPQFDLSDPDKVRDVLMDLYQKGVTHFQHGSLLKQDVNVARVSSWLMAESMKGSPGIFEENDPELTKWLKETMSQSDALIKFGIGGRASGQGGRSGGGGSRQGRGPKGKGAKPKGDNSHLRCFVCRKKVIFSILGASAS